MPTASDATLARRDRLDAGQVRAVRRLVDQVTEADGVRPLSEHVTVHIRYGGDQPARNLLLYLGGELVGYAFVDLSDQVTGASGELAVHPEYRRRGLGRMLVDALVAESPDGRLRLWAHGAGTAPAARALARATGFVQDRVLWQMRRSLFAALTERALPPAISVRSFVVGRDEQAWVELNNRAFAGHPEQGSWSVADVLVREREPWFDATGFFLAEQDGALVGFHWTKVHGAGTNGPHDHEPVGEVYVLGVEPAVRGRGLAPALTVIGLRHLRARGLSAAMLYVDEDNPAAIAVYSALGFARWDVDVCFRRP